jgi:hypothetical protein
MARHATELGAGIWGSVVKSTLMISRLQVNFLYTLERYRASCVSTAIDRGDESSYSVAGFGAFGQQGNSTFNSEATDQH